MMSVGDMEAFPQSMVQTQSGMESSANYGYGGMTYRQWLIGMALSAAFAGQDNDPWSAKAIGDHSIEIADAIIARLDAENAK